MKRLDGKDVIFCMPAVYHPQVDFPMATYIQARTGMDPDPVDAPAPVFRWIEEHFIYLHNPDGTVQEIQQPLENALLTAGDERRFVYALSRIPSMACQLSRNLGRFYTDGLIPADDVRPPPWEIINNWDVRQIAQANEINEGPSSKKNPVEYETGRRQVGAQFEDPDTGLNCRVSDNWMFEIYPHKQMKGIPMEAASAALFGFWNRLNN